MTNDEKLAAIQYLNNKLRKGLITIEQYDAHLTDIIGEGMI